MSLEIPNQLTGPIACNSLRNYHMGSFTAPTSPTKCTCDRPINTYNETGDESFEFETIGCFNVRDCESEEQEHQTQKQRAASLPSPAMAFADELFCDGKVMPLKPPPCLQYTLSPPSASPRPSSITPNNKLKFLFPQRSVLWNDDFDPFMVALENVKEEKKKKCQGPNHRRARSMSLLRCGYEWQPDDFVLQPNKQMETQKSTQSAFVPILNHNGVKETRGEQEVPRLVEPKGVLFARRARLVKMDQEWPPKPMIDKQNGGGALTSSLKENKRPKIKKLFKSFSTTKTRYGNEQTDPNVSKLMRKLSIMSMGLTQCKEMTKMAIVPHRPKLLLCMGVGATYAD